MTARRAKQVACAYLASEANYAPGLAICQNLSESDNERIVNAFHEIEQEFLARCGGMTYEELQEVINTGRDTQGKTNEKT